MEELEKLRQFQHEINQAIDTPTKEFCPSCTCSIPCGWNEQEIVHRIQEIIKKY